ncbi:S9 family peptidase [Agromyces archimandritae]|uniref:S9 family peptidase n=1 Tax=Agromyces archimandritae TaxID=2781962 RepID=A0A975FQP3_9MICO|nr:S9 family peptidase [Agromyces archimandritae]QTX05953.1 S9 family peptidase [Agromyces archimandritae]
MPTPPATAKKPTERIHHGDVFVDDYEWLREKDDPEVLAHLHEENAYTQAKTEHLAVLREQIFEEIKARTKETDLSVPSREGEWWYYTRTVEGLQYGIHCRVPAGGPDEWEPPALPEDGSALPGEQVLLDDNAEAEGHEFYSLGSFDISDDGTMLLYAVDTAGDERYTIRLRAVDGSGREFADEIPGTAGGAFFAPGGRYLFYSTVDDSWRPDTVWRHEVGADPAGDTVVFHEPDEHFWLGAGLTRSRRYLLIEAGSSITSETRILDAADPTGQFRVVWPREEGVEYDVEHLVTADGHDRLLIVHNGGGAVNFELVSVDADDPQGARRVVIPHSPMIRLEGVDAFAGFVAVQYRREGLPRVAVAALPAAGAVVEGRRLDDTPHELRFDEELVAVGLAGNPAWEQPSLRLSYMSFVTPPTVYDYLVATGELRLRKRREVLGGYDPADYEQRRAWATADDGARIPISLVYRRDLVTPGTPAPMLLYGYGSYEHSLDPLFSAGHLSFLDRGMVFAVAHVRGGGEMGRLWYEHGKKLDKRNTFTDFIACARQLIDDDWTAPDRLVAQGGSAGGLLMGAVANMAPGLFSGIVAQVPFVDALTSILDPELPLTVIEWDEWGDPLHDPEVYAYMKSYTPYENVHETTYPPILAVTSLNDTRVLYVEPAKWVAKLREVGADPLLKIEMNAGHGGVSGRYSAWREAAFSMAWAVDAAGARPSGE